MKDTMEKDCSRVLPALFWGMMAVGVLDGLYAVIFWGLRGAGWQRVFQGVSAGLLGRDAAVAGGAQTAYLGLAIHFFISACVVGVYFLASKRYPALIRRPILYGLVYGVIVYIVMNFVVIPLSAITPGAFSLKWFCIHATGHAFCVGLPAVLFVRRAIAPEEISERTSVQPMPRSL